MGSPIVAICAGTIENHAEARRGAIETPRLIWAVNVNEVSKGGPKPLLMGFVQAAPPAALKGRRGVHGSFLW
jgi:hypothetical protein